jgi:hypothetical protein
MIHSHLDSRTAATVGKAPTPAETSMFNGLQVVALTRRAPGPLHKMVTFSACINYALRVSKSGSVRQGRLFSISLSYDSHNDLVTFVVSL